VKYFKENTTAWQYLKPEEAERLVDACPDYFRPIVITALNTGMRKNEILGLKWFDVDFQLEQITVREAKNGEPRYILMNRTLTEILGKVRIRCKTEYVFVKRDGSPYKDIRKPFEKALREARVGRRGFHDLRHTVASQLVMKGVDLMMVKELVGHKTIHMTMRYAHLSQDHKKMSVERLSSEPQIDPGNNKDKKQTRQYS
jgi:integrase